MTPRRLALTLSPVLSFLVLLALAASRPDAPRPVGGAWDVTDFGARGNGVNDDGGAIQRAIDQAGRRGAVASTVYIPPGKYRVTRTLVVPSACGVTIRGGGMCHDPRTTGHYGGSLLVWDGPAGGTLIRGEGATLTTVENLSLVGRTKPDDANRAGILLHCAQRGGWGGGNWTVGSVEFIDGDVGLQFGTDESDGVCSDSLAERVIFHRCRVGFRVANNQGLNYVINYLGASYCQTAVEMARGGNLLVNGASITGDRTRIAFGGGGDNVAGSTLNAVRIEGGAEIVVGPYRRVEFNGLNMAAPRGPLTFDVTASTLLVTGPSLLRDVPAKGIKLRDDRAGAFASAVFRDAMFYGGMGGELFDVGDGCTLKTENCYTGWGK